MIETAPSDPTEVCVLDLIPMQDGFRRAANTMRRMRSFVSSGGKYDRKTLSGRDSGRTAPIVINRFEDGKLFIHDGLHRAASIMVGRRSKAIFREELEISERTYAEYSVINVHAGYFTPFDPQQEVRLANFSEFKSRVNEMLLSQEDPSTFIAANRHLFVRPRQDHHASLEKLLRFYLPELCCGDEPCRQPKSRIEKTQ